MASIYFRGKYWWIKFRDLATDKVVRKSLKTTQKQVAKNALRDLEARLIRGDFYYLKNIGFRAYLQSHLSRIVNDLRPNTVQRYQTSGAIFLEFLQSNGLPDMLLRKITPGLLKDFKAHRLRTVTAKTFNNDRVLLSALFNSAIEDGYLHSNPMKKVKKAKEDKRQKEWLTEKELQLLADALRPEIKPIVLFLASTGLRKNELAHLRWSDLNLERKTLTVKNREGEGAKSRQERTIPLAEQVIALLQNLPDKDVYVFPKLQEKTFREHGFWKTVSRAAKRASIKKCTPHTLRHTFASHLVRRGVPLLVIAKLLGHSHTRTSELYSHLAPDDLHDFVNLLPY